MRTSWRVEPSEGIATIVKTIAAREQRSIASVVTMLVGRSIDRERMDAAIEAAGLSKAVRTLEMRAISELKKNEALPSEADAAA
jgi:hypothetical protein